MSQPRSQGQLGAGLLKEWAATRTQRKAQEALAGQLVLMNCELRTGQPLLDSFPVSPDLRNGLGTCARQALPTAPTRLSRRSPCPRLLLTAALVSPDPGRQAEWH